MTGRFVSLVLLAVLAAGCGASTSTDTSGGSSTTARVLRVVDGDTIKVRLASGETERVRYIGIDTPESVKPDAPVECFAKRASARNEQLVEGRRIRLETDAEQRDRYGRLLAYVYRADDDLFVNAALVREGYAEAKEYPPNLAHSDELERLEDEARDGAKGLWSRCVT